MSFFFKNFVLEMFSCGFGFSGCISYDRLYSILAEVQHGTQFLSRTTLLQLLSSLISNPSSESMLRARGMMIIGRLMSKESVFSFIDEASVKTVISAIVGRLGLDNLEANESVQGATLLLSGSPPAARHVVDAAFDRNGCGKQLGLLLSVLQMESEVRLAGYRLITGLAARQWCLMEICSRQEIINIVTDACAETTKIGMEARHNPCQVIFRGLSESPKVQTEPSLAGVAAKLGEAVRRGPYLARRNLPEAQPTVMTADRF